MPTTKKKKKKHELNDTFLTLLLKVSQCTQFCWCLLNVVIHWMRAGCWTAPKKTNTHKMQKRANPDAENTILQLWQKLWLFEYVIIILNSLRIINSLHQFPKRRVSNPNSDACNNWQHVHDLGGLWYFIRSLYKVADSEHQKHPRPTGDTFYFLK